MHSALIDLSGKHSEIWINFPWMLRLPGDSLLTSTLCLKADRRSDLQAFAVILTETMLGVMAFTSSTSPFPSILPHRGRPSSWRQEKDIQAVIWDLLIRQNTVFHWGYPDPWVCCVFVVVYLCMCVCLGAPTCNRSNVTADGFKDVQTCWCGSCCAAQLHIKYDRQLDFHQLC